MKKIYKLTEHIKPGELTKRLSSVIYYISILIFIIGFGFTDTPTPFGWYQQFMPPNNNRPITDIKFIDSLTGWVVQNQQSDTSFILKTTDGGNNWQIIYRNFFAMTGVQFLNLNTGYACGGYLYKTTDGGYNWNQINTPLVTVENMFVLNQDTIWFVWSEPTIGGVFYTSNGGVSWQHQLNIGSNNPDRIYMYNARIGFVAQAIGSSLYRTTNGGGNWSLIANNEGFNDMYFTDSLTGWKAGPMKKTTNGGLNWVAQTMPSGGNISVSGILRFCNINKDTIWGCHGFLFYPGQGQRAFLHRTTDGGDTWYLQIPDTSYQIPTLSFIDFTDKLNGWSYMAGSSGIHTTTGGDSVFYLPVHRISSEVPEGYKLFQNYPNPFNPLTKIKYQIKSNMKRETSNVIINVYDISGKLVTNLVNENQRQGEYEVTFDGSNYSSGVYFYSLFADGVLIDTKKMILLK